MKLSKGIKGILAAGAVALALTACAGGKRRLVQIRESQAPV